MFQVWETDVSVSQAIITSPGYYTRILLHIPHTNSHIAFIGPICRAVINLALHFFFTKFQWSCISWMRIFTKNLHNFPDTGTNQGCDNVTKINKFHQQISFWQLVQNVHVLCKNQQINIMYNMFISRYNTLHCTLWNIHLECQSSKNRTLSAYIHNLKSSPNLIFRSGQSLTMKDLEC